MNFDNPMVLMLCSSVHSIGSQMHNGRADLLFPTTHATRVLREWSRVGEADDPLALRLSLSFTCGAEGRLHSARRLGPSSVRRAQAFRRLVFPQRCGTKNGRQSGVRRAP